jgi:hypothetical protein
MTFEDLESWQQARQLTLGLTYVIEDNYSKLVGDAVELRNKAIGTGQLVGGLMRDASTRQKLSRRMDDRDPAHWISVDQLKEHWKE